MGGGGYIRQATAGCCKCPLNILDWFFTSQGL